MISYEYLSSKWKINMLKKMMEIRFFELECIRQFDNKNILGTLHTCIGQEAVAVGCCEPLRQGDVVTSTHRGHGHFLAFGGSSKHLMAELFGRRDGYCRGKGGTQHIASFADGFLGSNGITGGGIPYSTGIGLAHKLKKTDSIAVCFFGDGACNQGTFHESLNIASIWKLPIIYVCENNQYAMSARFEKMVNIENLADRSVAYGIPGKIVDGNDVLATNDIMRNACEYARKGNGPVLIEAKTYRISGHSRRDQCVYRTKEEETLWAGLCPIKRLQSHLLVAGILSIGDIEAVEAMIRAELADAVRYAEKSSYLSKAEIMEGVFDHQMEITL